MTETERTTSGTVSHAGPWIVVAAVVVFVVCAHWMAVRACPVPVYGYDGAEYIEHSHRMDAVREVGAVPLWLLPVTMPRLLRNTDGPYPPLLYLGGAFWGALFGHGIPAAVHLNLLFLAILAAAVACATRDLPTMFGRPRGSAWSAALASSTILLTPAIFGSARRYYYDLPMVAWTMVVFAALCRSPVSLLAVAVGTVASAAALMTKWNAGFVLVPLWLIAAVVAVRDPEKGRRWRTLRQLAAGAVVVVVLCSPTLLNARGVRGVLALPAEALGFDTTELRAERESSLDNSLVQAAGHGDGGLGMQPMAELAFYTEGLVQSALGPMLAVSLLVIALVGFRGWRALPIVAVVGLPTAVLLGSSSAPVQDERFILPCVPLLFVCCWSMWDLGRPKKLRGALAAAAVLAGLTQLAAWDHHLPLDPPWTGRASVALRGWSRPNDTPCSPHAGYQALAEAACEAYRRDGSVIVSYAACRNMGVWYSLNRACTEDGYGCFPGDEAVGRGLAALDDGDPRLPLSVIVAVDRAPDGWPDPAERVWIPQDEVHPRTALGLYRFEASAGSP